MKTLDEVIKEELAKGKKLGEIKLVMKAWTNKKYWFSPVFKDIISNWHGFDSNNCHHFFYYDTDSWHPYTEPKKLKRFWLWAIKRQEDSWFKCSTYMDEKGFDSVAEGIFFKEWKSLEKIKIEDDYIEVEVEE